MRTILTPEVAGERGRRGSPQRRVGQRTIPWIPIPNRGTGRWSRETGRAARCYGPSVWRPARAPSLGGGGPGQPCVRRHPTPGGGHATDGHEPALPERAPGGLFGHVTSFFKGEVGESGFPWQHLSKVLHFVLGNPEKVVLRLNRYIVRGKLVSASLKHRSRETRPYMPRFIEVAFNGD